ncbi:MAG: phasin family protein [Tepidisphaeraceae bacterium]
MSDRTFDVSALIDAYRNAFAPALNAQQEGLKSFDRFARYQYAVAGDYLEFGLAHAKAAFSGKTGQELASAQTELFSRLGDQLRKRSEELVTIATESQSTLTKLVSEATAKAASVAKKAA